MGKGKVYYRRAMSILDIEQTMLRPSVAVVYRPKLNKPNRYIIVDTQPREPRVTTFYHH